MLPYQAVAMDYGGYQRQGPATGGHMGMGALGMGVGAPPFTHSWLVPPQDLCGVPYKQMPNQHPNSVMHPQQIEPGHVLDSIFYSFQFFSIRNFYFYFFLLLHSIALHLTIHQKLTL